MSTATNKDASQKAVTVRAAGKPGLETPGAAQPVTAGLELNDVTVLEALIGHDEPMTLRRIARLTDMPPAHLHGAVEALCELGLLRRLNTIVESYTARFQ